MKSDGLEAEEYSSLRDEMLRADDQTVTLTGFALVAASFLTVAVIETPSLITKSLLLIGFNVIIFTLVMKVREKRGQQGRIAAYVRVFHEQGVGWESRIHHLERNDALDSDNPWGLGDPREQEPGRFERFNSRAAIGEYSALAILSIFALVALFVGLVVIPRASTDTPAGIEIGVAIAIAVQLSITVLVMKYSRTFKELASSSLKWQRIWASERMKEQLRTKIRESRDVILINGGPASGKTSLGERLAAVLGLDLISKDSIKESVMDAWLAAGVASKQRPGRWSVALPGEPRRDSTDASAMDWFDDVVTRALVTTCERYGRCIIDANIAERQVALFESLAPRLVEILLVADAETLVKRYNRRADRHWVHEPKAAGDSSVWGGSASIEIPGAQRIEINVGSGSANGKETNATLADILTLLAQHYDVTLPDSLVPESQGIRHARALVQELAEGAGDP